MKTYTKEEKQKYFKSLRERWQASKKMAENDETAKALFNEVGGNFSYTSFYFTLQAMRNANYEGIPYVDCKTFHGWSDAGFKVRKGEHSKIDGITWMRPKSKSEDEEETFMYPKVYNLFHKSQVEVKVA